jgi:glucans biosynthesis protein C
MLSRNSRMSITLGNSATVGPQGQTERLIFVDVLRVLVIVFVIVHHAAQAYGPTGGAWPVQDRAHSDWFRPFYTVNSAFGLGLLFLLAGYFVPRSYRRKGPRRFLKERWARIGVPLVIFALVVHLPVAYLFKSRPALGEFIGWLYEDGGRRR